MENTEKKIINPETRNAQVCRVIGELKTKEQYDALREILKKEREEK